MEFAQYIRLFRKWLWLVLLAALLAGGISFIIRALRPLEYEAKTVLNVESAQTHASLVTTSDVLQRTINSLDLPLSVDELEDAVDTRILPGTALLVISATYSDPVLAADIANSLAEQIIAKSPVRLTDAQQRQLALANTQIEALNVQLENLRTQLDDINRRFETATSTGEVARLTIQRNAVLDQINTATSSFSDLTEAILPLQQRLKALEIVENASIPTEPSGGGVLSVTVLGALVGTTLAIGIALFVEFIDDRVRTSRQAAELLNLPVLGSVPRLGRQHEVASEGLITHNAVPAAVAESYRSIRTNLLFLSRQGERKVFVFTSPGPVEGKSATVANIAISMAQAGMRVLIIDADLRQPIQDRIFGLENRVGLTTLLCADTMKPGELTWHGDAGKATMESVALRQCVQETAIPNLKVITGGPVLDNPGEILASTPAIRWIDTLRESADVDIVFIDTPPALVVADSPILAGAVKADVVLVLDAQETRRADVLEVREQFDQLGIEILGAVLTRVNPRDEEYRYRYGYDDRTPEASHAAGLNKPGEP